MKAYFNQNFIFRNIEFDAKDIPVSIPVSTLSFKEFPEDAIIYDANQNSEIKDGCVLGIKFSDLLSITNETTWDNLLNFVEKSSSVFILDDLFLQNKELLKFKEFYLKTFICNFRVRNTKSFISKQI